jgi:hypothetical protein
MHCMVGLFSKCTVMSACLRRRHLNSDPQNPTTTPGAIASVACGQDHVAYRLRDKGAVVYRFNTDREHCCCHAHHTSGGHHLCLLSAACRPARSWSSPSPLIRQAWPPIPAAIGLFINLCRPDWVKRLLLCGYSKYLCVQTSRTLPLRVLPKFT